MKEVFKVLSWKYDSSTPTTAA